MSITDDPLTAQYYVLTYDEVALQRLVSDDGQQVVNQTVLVLSPAAKLQVLDVYPTGGDDGGWTARVAISEPAVRHKDGSIVPIGHLAEIKAQHAASNGGDESPALILPATTEGGDTDGGSEDQARTAA